MQIQGWFSPKNLLSIRSIFRVSRNTNILHTPIWVKLRTVSDWHHPQSLDQKISLPRWFTFADSVSPEVGWNSQKHHWNCEKWRFPFSISKLVDPVNFTLRSWTPQLQNGSSPRHPMDMMEMLGKIWEYIVIIPRCTNSIGGYGYRLWFI